VQRYNHIYNYQGECHLKEVVDSQKQN